MKSYSPVEIDRTSLLALKALTAGQSLPDSRMRVYTGNGEAPSPFRTRGLDFQEIRAYQPGDDIRQIDWKATAKHGKPYTKLYTDEKERPVYFVCDLRGGMRFASHGVFKSVIAARLTMFLAWLAGRKRDRIGAVIILPDEVRSVELTSSQGPEAVLEELVRGGAPIPDSSDTITLTRALAELAPVVKTGSMIFVLSDFNDFTPESAEILHRISARRTISLIRIYDALEAELPAGSWPITDGRTPAVARVSTGRQRKYVEAFQKQVQFIEQTVRKNGWGYLAVQTTDDYLKKLNRFTEVPYDSDR